MAEQSAEELAGVKEGELLAGKYRVEKILGVGGMGVVVSARHVDLDNRVALKFLLPELLSNTEATQRFAREARAAVRIQSEHVARVLDIGTLENGAPFMVMEYLEGEDLAHWIRQNGPIPIDQAVDFVIQACVAVADAHTLGIVHRDLKPGNLFCVRRNDGQYIIKVLDFGISKVTDPANGSKTGGMSMTRTAVVMGSPYYMSPEQVQSARDVDTRTDIWALGIILFELIAGKVPFTGDAFGEMAVTISTKETPSLRFYRSETPIGLESVIRKCLEKDRNRRFGDVGELSMALLPFAGGRGKASVERISGILTTAKKLASVPPPALARGGSVPPPGGETAVMSSSSNSGSTSSNSSKGSSSSGGTGGGERGGTVAPWSGTRPALSRNKTMMMGATAAFAGLTGIAGIAFGLWQAQKHPSDVHSGTSAPAERVVAEPTPVQTPPPAPAPVSPPPTPAPAEASAVAPEPLKELPVVPVTAPAETPTPAVVSGHVPTHEPSPGGHLPAPATPAANTPPPAKTGHPAAAPAAIDCDPPYTFDDQGRKVFKRECFLPKK